MTVTESYQSNSSRRVVQSDFIKIGIMFSRKKTFCFEKSVFLTLGLGMCDAPFSEGPLTTRQPTEYKWISGYPTPLQKIGQSLLCTGSSTQLQRLHETCPKQSNIIT